jgi:hypothetical protein
MADIALKGWGRVAGNKVIVTATVSDAALLTPVANAEGAEVSVAGQTLTNFTVIDTDGTVLHGPVSLAAQTVVVFKAQRADDIKERLIYVDTTDLNDADIRLYGWANVGEVLDDDVGAGVGITPDDPGLLARWYNGLTSTGTPRHTEIWNTQFYLNVEGSPRPNVDDKWTVLMTGKIRITTPGQYQFQGYWNDFGDLYVNRQLVAGVADHGSTTGPAVELAAGDYELWFKCSDTSNTGGFSIKWKVPGSDTFVIIPASVLFQLEVTSPVEPELVPQGRHYVETINRYEE